MNKHLFLLIILLINCTTISSQIKKYYFQHLGLQEGLSQSSVLCIIQDKKGFMWFGTKEGLNRYDGNSFRTFTYIPNDSTSLGNNVVNALYEDEKGILWVGTDNGVYLYNPITETFSLLNSCCKSQEQATITHPVSKFATDSDKNIWIAVESQGIFCFNRRNQQLKHYPIPYSDQLSTLSIDQHNTFWIGYKEKGLYYTNDLFKSLKPFLTKDNQNLFADDRIFTIYPELQNTLYIGSAKGGFKKINSLNYTVTDLLSNNEKNLFVRYIYPTSKNLLFIGTERGLYIYDKTTENYQHIIHNPNDNYSLSDNAIYSIYEDREGGIWIGSYFGGIDYYQTCFSIFEKYYPVTGSKNTLSGQVVREICEDKNGNLWIGTEDGGLNLLNSQTGEIHPYPLNGLHYNIHALSIDNHTLWIGTYSKGLYKLDIKTKQLKHYSKGHTKNSLQDNNIFSMCHTSSGKLYIGTSNGLSIYNQTTDNFTPIQKLNGVFVFNILEDHKGNIWFATYNAGIFKYSPYENSWKHYTANSQNPKALPYNKVISIYEDHNQCLWFCTQGKGIYSFNPEKETFTAYTNLLGLESSVIYKIIEVENNIFWMTSNKGLIRLDLNKQTSTTYSEKNGLLTNQFNYCSGIKATNGNIYLGSIKGLIAFNPKQLTQNTSYPPIAITDFLLFNKQVKIREKNSPIEKSITYTKKINLTYNQNSFSLRFTTLRYSTNENNSICYKLEGFDKEWYATSKNSIATYTNLKPGTYIFCIKSANEQGIWNPDITKILIKITPPFWLSIQAYIFYSLCLVALGCYIFYYLKKRLNKKHAHQLKILETEKEKEIYQAKIDFFTTIAHEIRTPLTLIKGPLENIMKTNNPNKTLLHENLQVMERNTQRLIDLVNQLLDFRKTEAQGFHLYFMECNISQLIKETHIRFNQYAQQNGLIFTIELPQNDFYAPVDKEAVTKILSNLFNNAIKYATSYIHASLHINTEKNTFTISVCNGGEPIPANMREKIFEPFIQIKDTIYDRNTTGSGIGLPLARSLAELHQGILYLKEGNEICFCLELPIKQENTIRLHKEAEEVTMHKIPQVQAGKCILVVEDDIEMQSFICSQIETTYRTIKANSGKEALDVLQQNEPISLIVSDVMMPQMDGFELCHTLKNNIEFSHIPIILLTAKVTLQSKIDGIELGANDYIEKPFSTEYLLARINNLLENQELLRQAFTSSPFVKAQSMALSKADEVFLKKLTDTIQKYLADSDFNVDILAEKMFMSRSSLHRKIKGVTQITPNEFIQLERLKTAAKLIQSQEYKINEICYLVGFSSPSYFAKCFQKHFGLLPKEFAQ